MRKGFIFLILLAFNFLLIYGINQANILMFNNNFMIYLNAKDKEELDKALKERVITQEKYDLAQNQANILINKLITDTIHDEITSLQAKLSPFTYYSEEIENQFNTVSELFTKSVDEIEHSFAKK